MGWKLTSRNSTARSFLPKESCFPRALSNTGLSWKSTPIWPTTLRLARKMVNESITLTLHYRPLHSPCIAEKCWPQIAADLRLRRNFLNHAIQTFMPTGCLVLLSWISFLIPPYIVPGRMVLLVTLLLVVFGTYSDAQ